MLAWHRAAMEMVAIKDDEATGELYGGEEFPPVSTDMTLGRELTLASIDEKDLDNHATSEDEERVVEWHSLYRKHAAPLSVHGSKEAANRAAAALFNAQLEADQRGNLAQGIAPCRMGEKPTTHGALQRAIQRYFDSD